MGYFKRPVRRRRARAEVRALVGRTVAINPRLWSRDFDLSRPPAESYLRFVVREPDGRFVGLFRSDVLPNGDPEIPGSIRELGDAAFSWFNEHVAATSAIPEAAVCWFRSDATECVRRLRDLIEVYRMAGHPVWMLATRTPGRIVYKDELQIAAVPFADRRPAASTW